MRYENKVAKRERIRLVAMSLLATSILVSLFISGESSTSSQKDGDTVRTLIRGVTYRESLIDSLAGYATMYCTYSSEQLRAESEYLEKHDLSGTDLAVRGAQRVRFCIKGSQWRIEVVDFEVSGFNEWGIAEDQPAASGKDTSSPSDDPRLVYCSDGERLYWWWPHINQGKIEPFRPVAAWRAPVWMVRAWLTLGLGARDYSSEFLKELGAFDLRGSVLISGHECYRIVNHHIGPMGPARYSVAIAPDAGFAIMEWDKALAFRSNEQIRGLKQVWRVLELQKVSEDLWLPKRTAYFKYMYTPQGGWTWRETLDMKFDQVEVNHCADESPFSLKFPMGTTIEHEHGTRWTNVGGLVFARKDYQRYAPPPHDATRGGPSIEDEFPEKLWNSWLQEQRDVPAN